MQGRLLRRYSRWRHSRYARECVNPALDATNHHFSEQSLRAKGYLSQCGQDKWIVEMLLPGISNGVFVDIGAHDGIRFSNTFFLEQKLHWTGVAVEPNPVIYERLAINRSCETLNCCIASRSGEYQFRIVEGYAEMLSGLVENYHPEHVERIEKEIERHGGQFKNISVKALSLNELLTIFGLKKIDYLSIDVEGAERSILEAFDFDHFDISVIGVENNYKDFRIPKLLVRMGYKLHSVLGDEFYVKKT